MKDTIYRFDAIKATWQEPTYTDPLNVLTEVRDRIESIPSADRLQGKWIFHSEWEEYWCRYECSLCGRTFDHEMNYCGFCGASMKGADDE